ncbi:MAG TPA: ATP-binding cassette domain-containing protein [Polyangiaceae bacterium]|nr:ATP-binding cassette domain-containing protein [Polyangiaceae bacterium]
MELTSPSALRPLRFQARLLQHLMAERRLLVRLAAIALLGALLGLAMPYTSRVALDHALPDSAPQLLLVTAIAVVLLVAHQAWVSWTQALTRITLSTSIQQQASRELMGALLASDYAVLSRRRSGSVMTTLSSVSTVVDRYVDAQVTTLTQGASVLASFAVLAQASMPLAGVVVLFELVVAAVCYGLARLEASHTRHLLERTSAEQQLLHVLMMGLTALRALYAGERLGARWVDRVRDAGVARVRSARAGAFQSTVHAIGSQTLHTAILIWAVYECVAGRCSIGEAMFLMSLSSGLSSSVSALIGVWTGMRGLNPHLERIDELSRDARAPQPAEPLIATSEEIVLDGVGYNYGSGRWVVSDHSQRIVKGSVVDVRSPSGSGKTTLLRLIAGLLPPSRGRITVFGVDATRARELVLYVPQHCKLFEASIRENLELLSGQGRAEIARVSALTGLDQMLRRLPMGEETLVGADGQNLSSGQRQLVVLTAAFASSRPVVLLDEATSQIDHATRAACRWDELFAGRTVVRVEHG